MSVFKTEITSDNIPSDNPVHQRLLKPYVTIREEISGKVLELGCGEGRGIEQLLTTADSYLAVDKIEEVIEKLQMKFQCAAEYLNGDLNMPWAERSILKSNVYI